MTCPFAQDDGSYVLGALAPAERAAFEGHLAGCGACREAVASLAVLPGLLGRLSAETATALTIGDTDTAYSPSESLPRVIDAAKAQRRRERRVRRWQVATAALAVVCVALAVGFGVHRMDQPPPVALTSMQPLRPMVPVTAEMGMVEVHGGTQVRMLCRYETGEEDGMWTFRLFVIPIVGEPEQVASWKAGAEDEVSLVAFTALAPNAILRMELRSNNGRPLLTWTPT